MRRTPDRPTPTPDEHLRDGRQPDAIRAGDADREVAAELLRTHHAAGRITDDEFQQRLEQSMAARTFGELRALVADLPDQRPPAPRVPPFHHAWRHGRRGWAGRPFLPLALLAMLLWAAAGRHHSAWHHGYHAHHAVWFPWPLLLLAGVALFALRGARRRAFWHAHHAAAPMRWV